MDLEAGYKVDRASGIGKETAYTVEARCTASAPMMIGDYIFDNRWREVSFVQGPEGVPGRSYNSRSKHPGMLGYSQAQALRWWLHAEADFALSGFCLQTRLIKHEISNSYKVVAVSQHGLIGGDDRSSLVPDWELESTCDQPAK